MVDVNLTLTKRHIAAIAVCWGISIAAVLYVSIHEGTVRSGANPLEREAHLSPVMDSRDYDPNEDIFAWARKHGSIIHAERAVFSKGGKDIGGVKATKDLAVGDLILAIPRKLVLTADKARESKIGYIFEDPTGKVRWTDEEVLTYFTLYIMMKHKDAGMWGVYGKLLSETYLGTPPLLSDEELGEKARWEKLHLPTLKKNKKTYTKNVETIMGRLNSYIKETQKEEFFTDEMLSTPNLLRANMLFTSRFWQMGFPNRVGRIKDIPFMVPIADMLNMDNPSTSFAAYEANVLGGSFQFVAGVPVKKGDEIMFYYGSSCREKLFAQYGFITSTTKNC